MDELRIAGWLPLPVPGWRPLGWPQALAATAVLLLALIGLAATAVAWRADACDQRGDYAAAVWWRPGVPMYHRQWAEALTMSAPRQAEQQLLLALRLNPYSSLAAADLATVELALGNWPAAVTLSREQQRRTPDFDDEWRLANLFLAHDDLAGFWQAAAIAAPRAEPGDFPSIASRALTASGGDFATLRRVLPPDSPAAASAFLGAATAAANRGAAQQGLAWLLALPPSRGAAIAAAREQAVIGLEEAAWRLWPADAAPIWSQAARAGLLPEPPKGAAPPYLTDGDFTPAAFAALRRRVPDPSDPLSPLLGWGWEAPAGVDYHQVLTGDPAYPTAAEMLFDGSEADQSDLQRQWILAPPATRIAVSVAARRLANRPEQGLGLELRDRAGHLVGDLPLRLSGTWQLFQGQFTTPATGLQAYLLLFHYHRPIGQMPLKDQVLVTQVRLR